MRALASVEPSRELPPLHSEVHPDHAVRHDLTIRLGPATPIAIVPARIKASPIVPATCLADPLQVGLVPRERLVHLPQAALALLLQVLVADLARLDTRPQIARRPAQALRIPPIVAFVVVKRPLELEARAQHLRLRLAPRGPWEEGRASDAAPQTGERADGQPHANHSHGILLHDPDR